MSLYPDLVSEYVDYARHRIMFKQTGKLDLSSVNFIYSTTLLPLSEIILKNKDKYIRPKLYSVANYIDTIINSTSSNERRSYASIVKLPQNCEKVEESLKKIFAMQTDPNSFGGESAFKYVVSELVDNIYQHSSFSRALIMGQRYDVKGFIDISFYDNGITIPQSFKDNGFNYEASLAIGQALNGKSTKDDDRGYGLRTTLKLFTKGLNSEFLIVSGNGAVYCDSDGDCLYKLADLAKLDGTLISARIPTNTSVINIYDYVE